MASITEYPVPTASQNAIGNSLFGITSGPDGNVYFTDSFDHAIGQITPDGTIKEIPRLPAAANAYTVGITLGASGELAFTEQFFGAIGEITTTGSYSQYSIDPTGKVKDQLPSSITATSNGTLWWTEYGTGAIGELTPDGIVHEYTVPGALYCCGEEGSGLGGITLGPDGNVWFTDTSETLSGDFVGRITANGVITEFPLPELTKPEAIASGPDGNLWILSYIGNTIDVVSTSGTLLHTYHVPVPAGFGGLAGLHDITAGSDKNLYFTEGDGNIGEITTNGDITIFPVSTTVPTVPSASGPQPYAITSGPDGNIWFTDPWTVSIGVLRLNSSPTPPPPPPPRSGTMTSVQASSLNPDYGESIALSAAVSPDPGTIGTPTGSVTFFDGTTELGTASLIGSTAALPVGNLPAGTNAITADYSGDTQFGASSSSSVDVTVRKDATLVSLETSNNSAAVDQEVTFTAIVSALAPGGGTPTGAITFMDGTAALSHDCPQQRCGHVHD